MDAALLYTHWPARWLHGNLPSHLNLKYRSPFQPPLSCTRCPPFRFEGAEVRFLRRWRRNAAPSSEMSHRDVPLPPLACAHHTKRTPAQGCRCPFRTDKTKLHEPFSLCSSTRRRRASSAAAHHCRCHPASSRHLERSAPVAWTHTSGQPAGNSRSHCNTSRTVSIPCVQAERLRHVAT